KPPLRLLRRRHHQYRAVALWHHAVQWVVCERTCNASFVRHPTREWVQPCHISFRWYAKPDSSASRPRGHEIHKQDSTSARCSAASNPDETQCSRLQQNGRDFALPFISFLIADG